MSSPYYEQNRAIFLKKAKDFSIQHPELVRQYKRKYKQFSKLRAKKFVDKVKRKYGCSKCGERDVCTLECHHLQDKKMLISRMIQHGYTIKRIKEELRKCNILCSNCHRAEHFTGCGLYANDKGRYCFKIKMESSCKVCGESRLCCLDFHHTTNKELNIGAMIRDKQYTLEDIIIEIQKCIILCSNCHRREHT